MSKSSKSKKKPARKGFFCILPVATIRTIKYRARGGIPQWEVIKAAIDATEEVLEPAPISGPGARGTDKLRANSSGFVRAIKRRK